MSEQLNQCSKNGGLPKHYGNNPFHNVDLELGKLLINPITNPIFQFLKFCIKVFPGNGFIAQIICQHFSRFKGLLMFKTGFFKATSKFQGIKVKRCIHNPDIVYFSRKNNQNLSVDGLIRLASQQLTHAGAAR